jgi:2-dehydropantoate 2-reductase
MRIAIIGAGAVGCVLAAGLSRHGHDVVLVGREEQVEAIRRDGLALTDPAGRAQRYRLNAVTRLVERPELALLTVKTQDVTAACAAIQDVARGVPVVAMQNGVKCDRFAAEVLGPDAVAGAVVMFAASYLSPGQVSLQFPGWLIVGDPFGPLRPRTRLIADTLGQAFPTYLAQHLERVRWSKLISTLNYGLCAATGLTLPQVARTPVGRLVSVRVMREGWRIARASGVRLDHGLYGLTPRALRRDRNAAMIAVLQATMTVVLAHAPERAALALVGAASRSRLGSLPVRSSLWQSVARGKPSEIEYLNGEIVRRGAQLGLATPYNSHIVALVHDVERSQAFCDAEALQPPGMRRPAQATSTAGIP